MRVLLFGATGYLGSALAARLIEAGHDVTTCGRQVSDESQGCRSVRFDLTHFETPRVGPHDVAVYAAQSRNYRGDIDRGDVVAVNTLGVVRAAELAVTAGVSRFVLTSTGSVYGLGDHPWREAAPLAGGGPYAVSKRMGEEVLGFFRGEFEPVILRLFALYGPEQEGRMVPDIVGRVAKGESVTLQPMRNEGTTTEGLRVSLLHRDDAVRVLEAALSELPPGVFNVGDPKATSIAQIARTAGAILGISPKFEISGVRDGDLVADTSVLQKCLALPMIPLEQGIRSVCDHL